MTTHPATKQVTIMHGINSKYSLYFRFNTQKQLDTFKKALEPLGYTFRTPDR